MLTYIDLYETFQGESTDNFNWGVRRRPLSEGEEREPSLRQFEESLSEKTPSSSKHTTRVNTCSKNYNVSYFIVIVTLDIY